MIRALVLMLVLAMPAHAVQPDEVLADLVAMLESAKTKQPTAK